MKPPIPARPRRGHPLRVSSPLLLTSSLGLAVALALYLGLRAPDDEPAPPVDASAATPPASPPPSAKAVVDLGRIEAITAAAERRAMADFEDRAQRAKTGEDGGSLAFVKWSFAKLWELRSTFNAPKHRAEVLDALLATPGAVDAAQRIVVDPAFAATSFGADQAKARVYAIKLLEHAAKNGDPAPVKATLTALNARLASAGTLDEGSRADVRDLLNAHVNNDFDTVFRDLEAYLRDTNYDRKLVDEYAEALQYAVIGKDGRSNEELRGYVEEMRRLLKADKLAMARSPK